jgi:hypothetical protein
MAVGEEIRALILASPAVVEKVVGRVFPAKLPQTVTFPAVRYLVVDDIPSRSFDGPGALRRGRVQVDAFAKKYLDAQALADALEGALEGSEWSLVARRDGYEDETELHRVSLDFTR